MSNYFKNRVLNYKDLSTGQYLDVSIDSSAAEDFRLNLNPSQLCFSIYDSRVNNSMARISMCIRYQNIIKLSNNISVLDVKTVFKSGTTISITQHTHKNKKELTLRFGYNINNEEMVQLTIMDNTSQRGQSSINVDLNTFRAISNILKECASNFIRVEIENKQLFFNYKILEKLNEISEQKTTTVIKEYVKENTDINLNEYNDDETTPSEEQQSFLNACNDSNMFSNVDLDIDMKKIKTSKRIEKVDKPFIGTFLNYDLTRLNEWATSFICLSEKADKHSFAPFDIIMNLGNVEPKERQPFMDEYGYYPIQYGLLYLLKSIVKKAVITGEYPRSVPAIRFSNNIVVGTDLYKLSQEILVVFLIYSFIMNNYINLKNVDPMKLDNIKRSYYTLKLLFSPFLFSLEINDGFVNELTNIFDACINCGIFTTIEQTYTELTQGGNMKFDKDMFEKYCGSFLNVLKKNSVDKFNTEEITKKTFNKYSMPFPTIDITCVESIKDELFKQDDKTNDNVEVVETEPVVTPVEELDPRLEVFLNVSEGYMDKELADSIRSNCRKMGDLKEHFKKFDVSAEIFKIKRAVEIDKNATTKREILKTAKLLKEDEDVTMSSGAQDVPEIEKDNTNIQEFLSRNNIF